MSTGKRKHATLMNILRALCMLDISKYTLIRGIECKTVLYFISKAKQYPHISGTYSFVTCKRVVLILANI